MNFKTYNIKGTEFKTYNIKGTEFNPVEIAIVEFNKNFSQFDFVIVKQNLPLFPYRVKEALTLQDIGHGSTPERAIESAASLLKKVGPYQLGQKIAAFMLGDERRTRSAFLVELAVIVTALFTAKNSQEPKKRQRPRKEPR